MCTRQAQEPMNVERRTPQITGMRGRRDPRKSRRTSNLIVKSHFNGAVCCADLWTRTRTTCGRMSSAEQMCNRCEHVMSIKMTAVDRNMSASAVEPPSRLMEGRKYPPVPLRSVINYCDNTRHVLKDLDLEESIMWTRLSRDQPLLPFSI